MKISISYIVNKPKLYTLQESLIFSDTVHINSQEGFPIFLHPHHENLFSLVFQYQFIPPIMLVRKLELFFDTTLSLTKTWPFYLSFKFFIFLLPPL